MIVRGAYNNNKQAEANDRVKKRALLHYCLYFNFELVVVQRSRCFHPRCFYVSSCQWTVHNNINMFEKNAVPVHLVFILLKNGMASIMALGPRNRMI